MIFLLAEIASAKRPKTTRWTPLVNKMDDKIRDWTCPVPWPSEKKYIYLRPIKKPSKKTITPRGRKTLNGLNIV